MNREQKDAFLVGHPSIVEFVATIGKIGQNFKWIQHDWI
jgi:hypothetical protein